MRGNIKILLQTNETNQNLTLNSFDFYEKGRTSRTGETGVIHRTALSWLREDILNLEITASVFIEVEITDLSESIRPVTFNIYQDPPIVNVAIRLLAILLCFIPILLLLPIIFLGFVRSLLRFL